jgi:signal transduction histidine kinase
MVGAMVKGRIFRVYALLAVCAAVLLAVQALLLARSWDLERRNFAVRSLSEAGDAFFRIAMDTSRMERAGTLAAAHPDDHGAALEEARRALVVFKAFGPAYRRRLEAAGIATPFQFVISAPTLIFRTPLGELPVVEALEPGGELRLGGELDPRACVPTTAFSYSGHSFYLRVNLRVQFQGLTWASLTRLKGVLVASSLSLLVFLGACAAILRFVRQQERLSTLKTDFINTMTHELNTPLSTIAVAAGTLKHPALRGDAEALDRLADTIQRQNARLRRMVDSVTKLAALEDPGRHLDLAPTSMHDLLAGAAEDLRLRFQDRDLQVEEDYRAQDDLLAVDPGLLQAAVFNLLDNAAKYSAGAPRIQLSTWDEGGAFHLRVADRGLGIPKEHRGRVFERFFRGSQEVPGLGLGLDAVRRIAQAHGGRVVLTPREGGGTAFTLTLPREVRP